MSQYVKTLLQSELEKRLEGVNEFMVVNTIGIDGITNNEMRGALKEKGVKLTVVKNSMMLKAFNKLGVENAEELFAGSCTLAYGGDSIVDVAKAMVDYAKQIDAFEVKGAYVDGECYDSKAATAISKMPTRAELQGQIVQLALTPGSNIAGAVMGPAGAIAGCIKSLIEKKEEEN